MSGMCIINGVSFPVSSAKQCFDLGYAIGSAKPAPKKEVGLFDNIQASGNLGKPAGIAACGGESSRKGPIAEQMEGDGFVLTGDAGISLDGVQFNPGNEDTKVSADTYAGDTTAETQEDAPVNPDLYIPIDIFAGVDYTIPEDYKEPPVEAKLPENWLADLTGDRFQQAEYPEIEAFFEGQGLAALDLYLHIYSNPQLHDVELPCVPGLVNILQDPVDGGYVFDANEDGNRVPVFLVSHTITDLNTGAEYPVEYTEAQRPVIGAVCGGDFSGTPINIQVPYELYDNGTLNVSVRFKVGVDPMLLPTNMAEYFDYRIEAKIDANQTIVEENQ